MERPKEIRELEVGDKMIVTNWWGIWVIKITGINEYSSEDGFICKKFVFDGMEEEGINSFSIMLKDIAFHSFSHCCILDGSEFYIFSGVAPFQSQCESLISSLKYNIKRIEEVF